MENGLMTLELEDGTTDFERLLVEPQDGHLSMDGVMCFNETIPDNVMDGIAKKFSELILRFLPDEMTVHMIINSLDQALITYTSNFKYDACQSCRSGGFAQPGKDVHYGEVLDIIRKDDEVGYLLFPNFCSLGEEYLLGVEFAESITNVDYGSSECLQTTASDDLILASSAGSGSPWKSDLFRIMDEPVYLSDKNVDNSKLNSFPSSHECDILAVEKPLQSPTSCEVQDNGKFHDTSSCSLQEVSSDDNRSLLTPVEKLCNPIVEINDESELKSKGIEANSSHVQDTLATALPKRSRKPTQRFIDGLEDSMSRYSKKRQELSSSDVKDLKVKDHKKCRISTKAMILPSEDTSVIAIQVPFGSLVHKKCPRSQTYYMSTESGNTKSKPKDDYAILENQKKIEESDAQLHPKRKNGGLAASHLKKRNSRLNAASFKRDSCIVGISSKKGGDRVRAVNQNKRDDCFVVTRQNKNADFLAAERPEEGFGRRKHHILWTIEEVKKLIDAVSQHGVGKWSWIKKLCFSSSAHRTSVDLKDKWRNLLKASGILERSNQKGKKKSSAACCSLPKSILSRVRELAIMYPYPRYEKCKISRVNHDSPGTVQI